MRRPRLAAHLLAALAPCVVAAAQAPPASPAFDVASIRPNTSGDFRRAIGPGPGGRFQGLNVSLLELVTFAYGVDQARAALQVAGGPDWMRTARFDVDAIAPGGAATPAQAREMVRTLLADRFKLQAHRETRELATFNLLLARDDRRPGPRLRPSPIDCEARRAAARAGGPPPAPAGPPPDPATIRPVCGLRQAPGRFAGDAVTMAQLSSALSTFAGRIVFDRTELPGYFDIDLEWTADPVRSADGPTGEAVTSLVTALREQLGLRLDGSRAPMEVVVVDAAEMPTPN